MTTTNDEKGETAMTRPPATPRVTGPEETVPEGTERRADSSTPSRTHAGTAKHRGAVSSDTQLERALLTLRKHVHDVRLAAGLPGSTEGEKARRDVLHQLDDYVLPRVRRSDTPLLIAVAGSTGAGKSTLVNSLVGEQVTTAGVRRPTTNSPVLACHPDDVDWFSEASFLPTLPRVRQHGLAMPGKDGMLVLAASECMPKGIALLDTPDVDSAVAAHHEFASTFLDAADLWLFVTTSTRYADARVWDFLRVARDRDTSLAVVLSRVPQRGRQRLVDHFGAMLSANGLGHVPRFTVPETDQIAGDRFTAWTAAHIREYLTDVASDLVQRDSVSRRTFAGVLHSFRSRVPELARHVESQIETRKRLAADIEAAYTAEVTAAKEAGGDGSLLRGSVLARWQDMVAGGDLARSLRVRANRRAKRHQADNARVSALDHALRDSLEARIVSGVEQASQEVLRRWRQVPGSETLMTTGELSRIPDDLHRRVRATVGDWQRHVVELVSSDGVAKRTVARFVTYDAEAFALVHMVGLLGFENSAAAQDATTSPRRLLRALFGAESLRSIEARAREDLRARIDGIFERDKQRFSDALALADLPEDTAAVQLYQATYSLEITQ